MTELETMASTFGHSKSIFTAELKYSGTHIEFEVKDRYDPAQLVTNDPVTKLLANAWGEHYNKEQERFEPSVDIGRAYCIMVDVVREFYVNHSPLKNPKQTRLYKWLANMDNADGYKNPPGVGFIALYRYIHGATQIGKLAKDNEHTKNVLAILELMREKYEGK